jgi:hypothetical protein
MEEAEGVVRLAMAAGLESGQYALVVKMSNNLAAIFRRCAQLVVVLWY